MRSSPLPRSPQLYRRFVAAFAAGALIPAVLAATATPATSAAPDDAVVASGPDWTVSLVAGGYQVSLELDEPLPMVSDAPTLEVDGKGIGQATESADSLTLTVVTADESVADAGDVELAWDSGDESKVEPTDEPVTSTDEPVKPSTEAELAAVVQRAAAGDDGSTPGPYTYKVDDYDFGDQAIDMAGIGGIRGELTGRIYLPDAGVAPGERPTIILLHGRHTSCSAIVSPSPSNPNRWPCVVGQTEVPSYRGYDGTGQTLATWGYSVVSISANAINANDAQLTLDNGAKARGQLVIDSLKMLEKANAGDPTGYHDNALDRDQSIEEALDAKPTQPEPNVTNLDADQLDAADLVGRFDLDNIGIMGHSRGGEGVVSTVTLNQALAQPFGIKSVLPLAPVDFARMTVADTPMMVLLPYCDGDVSNQQGQHFNDDSRDAHDDNVLLSTVWSMGANHNFFNTIWTPGKYPYSVSDDWGANSTDAVCGPMSGTNIRLTADQQYQVGTAYMSAWFRMTVGEGDEDFLPMFDGSTKPTLSSVPTADIRVIGSAPAEERVDIETFTEFSGKIRNYGSAVATLCASASGRTLAQALPFCGTTSTLRSTSAMPHWTPASFAPNVPASPMTKFLWSNVTGNSAASIRLTLPAAARNAAAYDALVFKTAPDESVLTGTDMTLTVVDGAGATWSSLVSALNPLAVKRMPASTSTTLNKIVLQEVWAPVSGMTGINTADIREVRLAAALGADATETGGAYLSDLALVNSAVGTPVVEVAAPTIGLDATNVEEGSGPSTKDVAVVLSKPVAKTVSGYYTLIGSTTATSKAALAVQKVTFAPGETCKAVTVPTMGDSTPGATQAADRATYKNDISNPQQVITGDNAFANLVVREDDGLTTGTPLPAVGVQGDVCAEYAAKSQLFALTATDLEPAPGETVSVSGTGFRNGEAVTFTDESTSPATVVGTVLAGPGGTATVDLVLPADAVLGTRTVSAAAAGSLRKAAVDLAVLAPTETSLVLDPAAPEIKKAVTLTATVTGADPAGTVEFFDGSTSLGSAPVSGGTASLAVPAGFAAGGHTLTAVFGKTATANTSTSSAVAFVVTKVVSTTDFAEFEIIKTGKKARLKMVVKVTGVPGFDAPTGTVLVKWGSKTKQVALPASGLVKVKLKKKGNVPPVTVTYSGDAIYAGSTETE
jgi:hypothetical protein